MENGKGKEEEEEEEEEGEVRRRDLRMSVSEIYCCDWKMFGSCF
jgi:hypothetical protein